MARAGHGDVWPVSSVGRFLDCAEIVTVLDDPLDGVVAFGRTQRVAGQGHHREFEKRGWRVEMSAGRPQWIPPPWLDPEQ